MPGAKISKRQIEADARQILRSWGEETTSYGVWLMEQLVFAYHEARKNKRKTKDEHIFEMRAARNLWRLWRDIIDKTYRPSRGIAFITHDPVMREIFAAPFRDRIVHHLLYNLNAGWWNRRFITDSYSCIPGRGTHYGIKRLCRKMRAVSEGFSKEAYVIKLDIQGYFMSLRRSELWRKVRWGLERQYGNKGREFEMCSFLWKQVIFDDPVRGVKRKGSRRNWVGLADNKSLFKQPPGVGIVIGNLSSQLLSNIYLDELDRFIRYNLGYKTYGRYVDDFYIIVPEEDYI